MTTTTTTRFDLGRLNGGVISAVFGLVWVVVNASGLPTAVAWPARVLAVFMAVVVMLSAARLRPRAGWQRKPTPRTWRVYLVSVALMLVSFPLGAWVLGSVVHRSDLMPLWVLFAVGAHFWPFARAFHAAVFRTLTLLICALAVVGAAAALAGVPLGVPAAAVLGGLTLLLFGVRAVTEGR